MMAYMQLPQTVEWRAPNGILNFTARLFGIMQFKIPPAQPSCLSSPHQKRVLIGQQYIVFALLCKVPVTPHLALEGEVMIWDYL
jgi:hypothetical protein